VFFKEVAHKSSCSCTCTCILCETRAKNRADLLYLLLYSVVAHKPNDKMTHVNNYKAHQPIKQMCVLYMTYLTKKQTKQIHRSVLEEELTHTRAKKGENPRSEQEKRGGEGGRITRSKEAGLTSTSSKVSTHQIQPFLVLDPYFVDLKRSVQRNLTH